MTYMLPGEVRCRECGHIGPAGVLETFRRPDKCALADEYLHGRPVYWLDCCERCLSENITTKPACVRCNVNDTSEDDYCHTCAIAIDTDDLLVESRAGLDRISDLHWTVMQCARGLR